MIRGRGRIALLALALAAPLPISAVPGRTMADRLGAGPGDLTGSSPIDSLGSVPKGSAAVAPSDSVGPASIDTAGIARSDSVGSAPIDTLIATPSDSVRSVPSDTMVAAPSDHPGSSARAPGDTARASPRWALVLSGGIARGFAHGGVIRALEQEGTRPDLVVGTSSGGLVGALYAAGYSPDSIRGVLHRIPWDVVFGGVPSISQWRSAWPEPWFEVVNTGGGSFHFPGGLVDNTLINATLTDLFLDADAAAQGDFDHLPIPFRTVGTDVRTGRSVVLDHGSLARAVRITCGLPLLFPPVAEGEALLVDGGMSSNLPIAPARAAGAQRVLAVDVSQPYPKLDESSSGIVVFMQLWDIVNKRGQSDTVSVAAGDTLVWLRLPNADPADFRRATAIFDQGYEEGGAAVRSWARRSGLPHASGPLAAPTPLMPPLVSEVEWHAPEPVLRQKVARALLGKLPTGPFHPTDLSPALRRLALSGLFESAWPTLINRGDSTVLSFEVRERPAVSVGPALTLGNDEGYRFHLGLTYRPTQGPLPALVRAGLALRRLGWTLDGSLEPYALDYGQRGWFLRGQYHELNTRVFNHGDEDHRLTTWRGEMFAGGQFAIPQHQSFQAGVGLGSVHGSTPGWTGLLLAFRSQPYGRTRRNLDAEWAVGGDGYARLDAAFDLQMRRGGFALIPGVHAGAVDGTPPADALVGLGGPHSLSGLHHDEWLGRRAYSGSLELALESPRQARAYVAGQIGIVDDAVSGADLGSGAVAGLGIGGSVNLPIGPLEAEWGVCTAGRSRFDVLLGTRF